MVELSIGFPQIVVLLLYLCNITLSAVHHGEERGDIQRLADNAGSRGQPHYSQVGRFLLMAYGDYGAFVYLNGERRTDKEDVGVYDTDEDSMKRGGGEWFEFPHHGVMGDGSVRVGCYKQGWPEVYEWEVGKDKPTRYTFDDLSRKFGWNDYVKYGGKRHAADEYEKEFDFLGWHFHFWGNDSDDTPRYGATMSCDRETWVCDYDCMFGAGFDDIH